MTEENHKKIQSINSGAPVFLLDLNWVPPEYRFYHNTNPAQCIQKQSDGQ
jgi:hypothetical protein